MKQYSRAWLRKRGGGKKRNDIKRYLDFPAHAHEEKPDVGPLRNMIGVQFYFDSEVRWIEGHTMLSDSPWGIALVSQAQFWSTKPRSALGYVGVVSAAFSRFEEVGTLLKKKPKDMTRQEIAEEVWAQILQTVPNAKQGPKPALFYIDAGLEFDAEEKPKTNKTPYLVNHAGQWGLRGGRRVGSDYEYDLQLGNVVFAGVFMRTHTRLTTMESANESARRAVNTILREEKSDARPCEIFDMECVEWADARDIHRLDAKLLARGGSHPMDNMLTKSLLQVVPWRAARLFRRASDDQ